MIFRRRLLGVLGQLANEGLLTEGQLGLARAEAVKTSAATPWFVRLLVGAGAWVAALLLIALLALLEILRSSGGSIALGLVLLVASAVLRRATRGDFPVQLAISGGLAGATMVVAGTGLASQASIEATLVTAFVVSLAVVAFFPDTLMRFLATCVAAGSTVFLFHELKLGPDVAVAIVAVLAGLAWIFEARLRRHRLLAPLQRPVGYGLVVSLLAVMVGSVTELDEQLLVGRGSAVSVTVATLVLVFAILREHRVPPSAEPSLVAAAAVVLLGAVMITSPGVLAALFVIGLAFHRRNPLLLALAIVTLIAFGVFFYYRLEVTLLVKAGVLAGSGLVLLGLREYVRRRYRHLAEEQPL